MEDEWEFSTLALANAVTAYQDSERARRIAGAMRAGMTPRAYMSYRDASVKIDVRDMLQQISVPTIVVHDRTWLGPSFGPLARRLAPFISNARLVETDKLAQVMDEFLREGEPAPEQPSGTAIILFADIADSTALTERLGDAAFRDKARELDEALRRAITSNGGTAIDGKLLGDGVLATFGAAREAIACAAAIHDAGSHAGPRLRTQRSTMASASPTTNRPRCVMSI